MNILVIRLELVFDEFLIWKFSESKTEYKLKLIDTSILVE